MVAFSFSDRFVSLVESGLKTQTIRQTRRAKIGDAIQLYTGLRTKACRKLTPVDPICTYVGYVAIRPDYLTVGDTSKHPRDRDEFAALDGFKDYADMLAWFQDRYGQPSFIGYLHRWEFQ